jgi:HSP20 family protein
MRTLERWTPVRELDQWDRRMRDLFGAVGLFPAFVPAANVYETDDEIVVEVDLPGFDEADVDVEISDRALVVTGRRADETEAEKRTVLVRERLETDFERRFVLPAAVDTEHATAEYVNGVLTVHVPKTLASTPRKVEVASA